MSIVLKQTFRRVFDLSHMKSVIWFLWAAMLLTVPITSSPLMARLTSRSTVSPLASLPLLFLLLLWFVPYVLRGEKVSRSSLLLIIFVGVALLSCALVPFYGIEPYMGQTAIGRTLRALVTLIIGVGFYFIAAHYPRSESELRGSLKWIYLGALLMLIWASVQIYFVRRGTGIPIWAWKLHRYISIRDMHKFRVTGLAYEPSWMANQMVILYLPLWISSLVHGYSICRLKILKIPVEFLLLLWSAVVLFFSLSRIGLLNAVVILIAVAVAYGGRLVRRLTDFIRKRFQLPEDKWIKNGRDALSRLVWVVLVVFILLSIFTVTFIACKTDYRIARLFKAEYFQIIQEHPDPIYEIARRQGYAERLAYWTVGFKVFETYPLLGAGLGDTGFFYLKMLPAYGYRLPETIRIVNGSPQFPNPKNFWIRLLAETGIVGFLVFLLWLILMTRDAWSLYKKGKGLQVVVGFAGLLALLAQILEGFSLDTFALPQLWIMLGLLTATCSIRNASHSSPAGISRKLENSE
jgi:O-antigen ligase